MLDFNRHYYEETCGYGPLSFARFEPKPGKNEQSSKGLGLPQTFRFEDSNADEKRTCLCHPKKIVTQ
jgi:hypothetical protein